MNFPEWKKSEESHFEKRKIKNQVYFYDCKENKLNKKLSQITTKYNNVSSVLYYREMKRVFFSFRLTMLFWFRSQINYEKRIRFATEFDVLQMFEREIRQKKRYKTKFRTYGHLRQDLLSIGQVDLSRGLAIPVIEKEKKDENSVTKHTKNTYHFLKLISFDLMECEMTSIRKEKMECSEFNFFFSFFFLSLVSCALNKRI